MIRPLLFVLLAASIAANLWLAFDSRPAVSAPAPSVTSAGTRPLPLNTTPANPAAITSTAKAAVVGNATSPAPRGFTWKQPVTDEDFRQLAADLRTAGFPSRLIADVLRDLYQKHTLQRSPLADAPYWQRRGLEVSPEMQNLYRSLGSKLEALLGTDGRPSLLVDPVTRQRLYGNLPDAKIDAIAALERDYRDMSVDVNRSTDAVGFSSDSLRTLQEQTKLLDAEKFTDLANILTPAELAEYQQRNSTTARQLARTVSNFALTPEEFSALYAARAQFDEKAPQLTTGVITPELMLARQNAQNAYYAAARATLPDDRFYTFLQNNEPSYRTVVQLAAQYPSVTPAGAYTAWSLQSELRTAMTELRKSSPSPEQITALYAGLNARLDAALGSDAAKAFRATPGGRPFNPPTIRRSTPATTPPRN